MTGDVTAHLASRIRRSGLFANGIYTTMSSLAPQLQLEGHITECIANGITPQNPNAVLLSIHITVERLNEKGIPQVVMQKVYSQRKPRAGDGAASIAPALGEAVSAVADAVMSDLSIALKR